VDDVLTYNY